MKLRIWHRLFRDDAEQLKCRRDEILTKQQLELDIQRRMFDFDRYMNTRDQYYQSACQTRDRELQLMYVKGIVRAGLAYLDIHPEDEWMVTNSYLAVDNSLYGALIKTIRENKR